MYVQRINNLKELSLYCQRWDELAGDRVFQTWTWVSTWWAHYGQTQPDCDLAVFLVFDQSEPSSCHGRQDAPCSLDANRLVAILPCYYQQTFARGKVLRLLGDGEVCSDHLDLLVAEKQIEGAAKAIARYLTHHSEDWDLADFGAVEENSTGLNQLFTDLQSHGCHVTRRGGQSSWSVELPATWDEFLALQSKSHRKQLRRLDNRVLNSDRAVWHLVKTAEQFDAAWELLIDLHQRRRNSLNEPGCFASERWAAFHRDVARQLLEAGQLRLSWLELDGKPIAAEYHFATSSATLAYQGGLDPDRLDEEPGRLSMIRTFQHAMAEGHTTFDLLRGDEPYKAHWRATPQTTYDVQIVPARRTARLRHQVWSYLRHAGQVARKVTNLFA